MAHGLSLPRAHYHTKGSRLGGCLSKKEKKTLYEDYYYLYYYSIWRTEYLGTSATHTSQPAANPRICLDPEELGPHSGMRRQGW